jgi:hypothetical protein
MSVIEVRTGFVFDVADNGAGVMFKFGEPPVALSIGAIPSRMPAGTLTPTAVETVRRTLTRYLPCFLPWHRAGRAS